MPQRFAPTSISTSTSIATPAAARRGADVGGRSATSSASTRHRGRPAIAREPRELRGADDLVGDEHVAHAGGDERLRLADLLAADADGAALELRERDLRALVRLRVRAQRDAGAAHRVRHQVEVALERVEVDDERRGVDVVDGIAGCGQEGLHDADRNPRTRHRTTHRRGARASPRRHAHARDAAGSYFGAPASAAASCP